MRENSAQPSTAAKTAAARYSEALIGASFSPSGMPNTREPPGTSRQTTGTSTAAAENPICLKVLAMEMTLVRSVGSGVSTAAMACEGTSPSVMAMLHSRKVMKI